MRTLPLSFEICYRVNDKGYIQERDDNFATMLATICYIAFIAHTVKSRYSIFLKIIEMGGKYRIKRYLFENCSLI